MTRMSVVVELLAMAAQRVARRQRIACQGREKRGLLNGVGAACSWYPGMQDAAHRPRGLDGGVVDVLGHHLFGEGLLAHLPGRVLIRTGMDKEITVCKTSKPLGFHVF